MVGPSTSKPKPPSSLLPKQSEAKQGIPFGSSVTSRSWYISFTVPKPAKAKTKLKSDMRKHEDSFFSIECPPIYSDWKEAAMEITANFVEIVEHIFNKDKKAIMHPWDSSGGPLMKKSDPVKIKQHLKRYTNSLWIQQGFPTLFRIRVSHADLPSSTLKKKGFSLNITIFRKDNAV
jgi:hypothetical protein